MSAPARGGVPDVAPAAVMEVRNEMSPQADAETLFQRLLAADKALREAHKALLEFEDRAATLAVLRHAADGAMAADHEDPAAVIVVLRLVDLLCGIEGRASTALLVRLLGHSAFVVEDRVHLAIEERMSRCLGEVEEVIEAAVDEGEAADPKVLIEVSAILGMLGTSSAIDVLSKLLRHPDGDVVAAAVEALVRAGSPSVLGALEALENDPRPARVGNVRTEEGSLLVMAKTVGQVARAAVGQLGGTRSG